MKKNRSKNKQNKLRFNTRKILIMLAIPIIAFNLVFKSDLSAVGGDFAINHTNLLSSHNEERSSSGFSSLTINEKLNNSAQAKADAMLIADCWAHYCPNGKSPWEFFDEASYDYVYAGENLAEGFYKIDNLMNAWMNSQTHRENILNNNFNEVGFGISYGKYQSNDDNVIVVVHFGKRSQTSQTNGEIRITQPVSGSTISQNTLNVEGTTNDIEDLNLFINSELYDKPQIAEGLFTSRVTLDSEGDYRINATGTDTNGSRITSNTVEINYKPSEIESISQVSSSADINLPQINISPDMKNLLNVIFILVLAIIFLFDFLLLSRTKIVTRNNSFSHYHFAILIILVVVIIIGGIAGNVANGIAV